MITISKWLKVQKNATVLNFTRAGHKVHHHKLKLHSKLVRAA